uniref:Ankyrin repeat and SOCS box containing 15b n=1 Tax=Oncorhynchus tshawytscha TaxID=74940 RepID=A0A8C8JJ24_ONCTS
ERSPGRDPVGCFHVHMLDIALNGKSVLTDAVGTGNPDCIELLLKNGANPNLPSLIGQLPIHKAAHEGHYDPIHSAVDSNHSDCMELLIENGFNMDLRRSTLYFAVSRDIPCVEMLLNAGAKPELDPLCCLLVAARAGRYEIVKLLLARQADVNCYFTVVSNTVLRPALHYCLRDEMMCRLLNNGYDVERCFTCNHDDSLSMKCVEGRRNSSELSTFFSLFPLWDVY